MSFIFLCFSHFSQHNIIMYARKGTFDGRGMVGRDIKTAKTAIICPSKPKIRYFFSKKMKKTLEKFGWY